MKKHLVIVHPFDPWGNKVGGIETAIRLLIQHTPVDFRVSLIGVTEDSELRPVGRWKQIEYQNIPVNFYPLFPVLHPNRRDWFPLFLRFSLHLRRLRMDLGDAIFFYHRIEPIALSRLHGRKNLLYVHSHPREWIGAASEVRWKYIPRVYRWMEHKAIAKADHVFSVTQGTVWYFQQRYTGKKENFSFLPTGFRDDLFFVFSEEKRRALRLNLSTELGPSMESSWILFAGRMEEQKNPLLAVRAFTQLLQRMPKAHLIMAGEGYLSPNIHREIEGLGLQEKIHLLGSLSAPILAEWMRACDLFLLTSQFEGMPIAVLEALASGLPVVCTDTGELRNMIQEGKTGRIVRDMNLESLVLAIEDMLKFAPPERRIACAESVELYRATRVAGEFFERERTAAEL